MSTVQRYPKELRERATRLAVEARQDSETKDGAIKRVAEQLGINHNTLRTWVVKAERNQSPSSSDGVDATEWVKQLEKEVFELKRANAILKQASAFFAA